MALIRALKALEQATQKDQETYNHAVILTGEEARALLREIERLDELAWKYEELRK